MWPWPVWRARSAGAGEGPRKKMTARMRVPAESEDRNLASDTKCSSWRDQLLSEDKESERDLRYKSMSVLKWHIPSSRGDGECGMPHTSSTKIWHTTFPPAHYQSHRCRPLKDSSSSSIAS